MKLKYFSHSAFKITTDSGKVILIDPFLDGNPTSPVKSDDVTADYIILTHAHGDTLTPDNHFGGEPAGVLITADDKTLYHAGILEYFLT